jgi:hypothetical protein
MKPITLTKIQWAELKEKINNDYPPSVSLVREKMKRVLGFTPRFYERYDEKSGWNKIEIHLDFFDDQKRTMFLLKYSDYVIKNSNN